MAPAELDADLGLAVEMVRDPLLEGTWTCGVCTFENSEPLGECEVCSADRGTKSLAAAEDLGESPRSNENVTPSSAQCWKTPQVYICTWAGGSSSLTVGPLSASDPGGAGANGGGEIGENAAEDQECLADFVCHVVVGDEPNVLWDATGAAASALHEAAGTCARALADHIPPRDFLPVFCRPEHVVARRNFAREYLRAVPRGVMLLRDQSIGSPCRRTDRNTTIMSEVSITDVVLGQLSTSFSIPPTPANGNGADMSMEASLRAAGSSSPVRRCGSGDGITPADATREQAILARQVRLRKRVEDYGLLLDEMESDGNCLFRAVSRQIYGASSLHALVRHRVVSQLHKDRLTYRPFFTNLQEMQAYLADMAAEGFWGDELVLRAMADTYNAELHVLTSAGEGFYLLYAPTDSRSAVSDNGHARSGTNEHGSCPRIFLAYTYPVHYDGLLAEPLVPENKAPMAGEHGDHDGFADTEADHPQDVSCNQSAFAV
eukprot:TRINITY_DN7285_c1_g1_i2.p1 TRINITY_DN7285_c1_g1~~TRINITY_DN7285_c1_g1_i2.p1  ORF type:complete len:490 (+),score=81.03 TRINITY_DN7285_c1_g1_i2:58-1527(+)